MKKIQWIYNVYTIHLFFLQSLFVFKFLKFWYFFSNLKGSRWSCQISVGPGCPAAPLDESCQNHMEFWCFSAAANGYQNTFENTHDSFMANQKTHTACYKINEIFHMPPPAKPGINNGQLVKCHTKTHFTQDRHISSFFHVYRCQSDPPKNRNNDILPTKQATIFRGPNMTRILHGLIPTKYHKMRYIFDLPPTQ